MNEPTVPQSLPSYFQRLHQLFDHLLELPYAEREAELTRIATNAPELAAELRALLDHAMRTDSPLDHAAVRLQPEGELPPPRISGFRIHHCIGRGGSATVYLAEQEHTDFTRTVALKVVDRLSDMSDLRSVREEQRILARLEHPGIARLYDAGTTADGQQWMAMEHVEGESILEHCRSHELSMRERIALFLPVLDAVAYAHARNIVHRDLKPANIFVTGRGEPRLLDFGIAKLSDPTDRDETRTLRRALTPAYASPEQMRGGRTTAASDIYSLGVVLYELLTGSLPHDTAKLELEGDIAAVLGKALRERPEDRYATVSELADDLRHVLDGTPVAARRRARRRIAFAIAAVVLVIAAGAFIVIRFREPRLGNELAIFRDADSRWLRDGAERLARYDALGARDSFRRATQSSKGAVPEEALAWDGVARAESTLGEIGRANDAARRAGALIAGHMNALPKHEAERLRARALAASGDWNAAIAALEKSLGDEPERIDIGLDLVSTLLACGRTGAADTAFGRVRQIARAGDPRIDLMDAEVALQYSAFQRAAASAAHARDAAARVQAVALGQRAARLHADAISRLDQRDDARRELTAAISRDVALGLTGEAAEARLALAGAMLHSAGKEETRRMLEAARSGCAASGDRRCEISARMLLAMLTAQDGKLTEAIHAAKVAQADAQAIGDRWCEGYVLAQLQVLYNWADDPASVEALTEPTLAALRDSGNRRLLLTTLTNVAVSRIESLDIEKAEVYVVEAEDLARNVGSQVASASIDHMRGYLEETRGDLDLARRRYTSALEKARHSGGAWNIAKYLYDLAWLEVAADQPAAAAARAREAMAMFNKVGDAPMAMNAEGALAWSEARQGNTAAAQQHIANIQKVAAEGGDEATHFNLLDIEGHVAEASGDWRREIEIRHQTVRMAKEWGARGVVIRQQVQLAVALHHAGERRELQQLIAEILPEVDRQGLRGIGKELRELQ